MKSAAHREISPKAALRIAAPCIILAIALWLFTRWYISKESTFYWSDYNAYFVGTRVVVENFNLLVLGTIWGSTSFAHNLLFTLPIAIVEKITGVSRLAYVGSLVELYFLPFVLMMGAIATRLTNANKAVAFVIASAITLLLPVIWAPALRGVPDHCAAFVMASAVFIYLGKDSLKSNKSIVIIGVLLASSALLRRHYAYGCVAFMGMALIREFLRARNGKENFAKEGLVGLVKIGTISLAMLCTFGILFILEIFTHNWNLLDRSLEVPPSVVADYFLQSYGLVIWLLSLLGLILGFKSKPIESNNLIFVSGYSLLFTTFWIFSPKLIAVHFPLHAAMFVVFGLTCLTLQIYSLSAKALRFGLLTVLALLLVMNFAIGMAPYSILETYNYHPTRFGLTNTREQDGTAITSLFSANYGPRIRSNRELVLQLADAIYQQAAPKSTIYVAAGGEILQCDILSNALRERFGKDQHLQIPEPPTADSMHAYPIDLLTNSDYVVCVNPIDNYIDPAQETVIQSVLDCFNQDYPLASNFKKAGTYPLGGRYHADLFKRIAKDKVTEVIQTLERFKSATLIRPEGQARWINSSKPTLPFTSENPISMVKHFAHKKDYTLTFKQSDETQYLLTADYLQPGQELTGTVKDPDHILRRIVLNQLDKTGAVVESQTVQLKDQKFTAATKTDSESYGQLVFTSAKSGEFEVELQQ